MNLEELVLRALSTKKKSKLLRLVIPLRKAGLSVEHICNVTGLRAVDVIYPVKQYEQFLRLSPAQKQLHRWRSSEKFHAMQKEKCSNYP